jgi:signal transduction histidine kinase
MLSLDPGTTPKEHDQFIFISILCLCAGILAADVLIPLGFVIWILYIVPLLMSVWISHRYAPFFVAWFLAVTILMGGMISGAAHASPDDLPNRAIFILMLTIISLLVWEIKTNYTLLEIEIAERRAAQEGMEVLTRTLEERVAQRTHELSVVNAELSEVNAELKRDIAERERIEAALAMANQKLNLLTQITRHDISNRVFALLVELDLAKETAGTGPVQESLDLIGKTAMTIQDQIAFAKDYQEIGAQVPGWHRVDAAIRGVMEQRETGGVKVTCDLGGIEIFADPMIGKVFYNLIDNALRHGDQITRIAFSRHMSGSDLVIVCEDDGIGIPETEKQHIFTKGFGKDSGLGLFLIREILSITGISITETGTQGKGARFEITVHDGNYRALGNKLP